MWHAGTSTADHGKAIRLVPTMSQRKRGQGNPVRKVLRPKKGRQSITQEARTVSEEKGQGFGFGGFEAKKGPLPQLIVKTTPPDGKVIWKRWKCPLCGDANFYTAKSCRKHMGLIPNILATCPFYDRK